MYTTDQIIELIKNGNTHEFYNNWAWRKLSKQIRKEQNNECQLCKAKGRYRPVQVVHHVKHLKKHPELAYSRYYYEGGTKHIQLMAVCNDCHEALHPEKFNNKINENKFVNVERW